MSQPEWVLIGLLWAAYVLNHADRQVLYTLFPALQSEFGLSNTMLGLMGALFLWIYGLAPRRQPRPLERLHGPLRPRARRL
jgi:sugar phosphate permease